MFAATTAIQQFWNKDEELLFLGRWCIQHLQPAELERLRYKFLPNPWNDRRRLDHAIKYVDRFSESALVQLSEYLNQHHGVRLDIKYWRAVVGPWLIHYSHVLYDRYTILCDAWTAFPGLETIVLDAQSSRRPADTESFVTAAGDDPYNLQIFSSILRGMGHNFPSLPYDAAKGSNQPDKISLRARLIRVMLLAESTVGKYLARDDAVAMYSMYWKRPELWALTIRSRFKFFPLTLKSAKQETATSTLNLKAREELASTAAGNEFEKIFWRQAASDLPQIYLEDYQRTREAVLSSNGKIPGAVMSDSAWIYDEPFKFFAAEAHRQGRRLLVAQHGGSVGMARYNAGELHDARIADAYFVWGWADARPKHHNLPSPRIGRQIRPAKNRSSILFISTANPLYLYRFQSQPLGDQWSEYFDWQLRFIAKLSVSNRRALMYRPYPIDYGVDITARIQQHYPEIAIYRGPLDAALKASRLVVVDNCVTTLLETLAANIPTILYWDPNRWELRDDAIPYAQRLAHAGILWPSPDEAAQAVERVYDGVQDWWNRKDLQDARRAFTKQFAIYSDDWIQAWKTDVARVLSEPQ